MNSTAQSKQSQGHLQQKPPVRAGQQGTQKTDFRPEARGDSEQSGSTCSTNKVK